MSIHRFLDVSTDLMYYECNMQTVAAYYRVSTASQDLESQKYKVREYAKNNNYQIVKEFEDYAFSGANYERPALLELQQWTYENQGSTVLMAELDRAARDYVIYLDLRKICRNNNIRLLFLNVPQTGNPEIDSLLENILAAFAEFDKTNIKNKLMRGKMLRLKSGNPIVSRVGYGYLYIKTTDGNPAQIITNPDEADVVKLIFDLFVEKRMSINGISKYLGIEKKIPTQNKSKQWSRSTLHGILSRSCYATGDFLYSKYEYRHNGKRSIRLGLKKEADWIHLQVPTIIDKETFDRAQELLKLNKHKDPKNKKYEYLLSSLLRCGVCGKPYQAYTNKPNMNRYYRCSNRNTYDETGKSITCKGRLVTASFIEPKVWDSIKDLANNFDVYKKNYFSVWKEIEKTKKKLEDNRDSIVKKIDVLEKKRSDIMAAINSGILGVNDLIAYNTSYNTKKEELDQNLRDVTKELDKISPAPNIKRVVFERRNLNKELSFEQMREYVMKYIREITVLPEKHKYRIEFVVPYESQLIDVEPFKHSSRRFSSTDNATNINNLLIIRDVDYSPYLLSLDSIVSKDVDRYYKR